MKLAALLLLLVAGCHYLYDPISALYPNPERAAKNLFYCFRGIEGAALFGVIAVLAKNRLVMVICAWGMFEESQTAICSVTRGLGVKQNYAVFEGLCGPGLYSIGLVIAAVIAYHLVRTDSIQTEK